MLGLLVVGSPEAPAGPTESPNIIFILLDDAGYRDFGAMGNGYIQSPSIDAFARSYAEAAPNRLMREFLDARRAAKRGGTD